MCPHCHNRDLVLSPGRLPDIPLDDIWAFLERRHGLLDGVAISGGEPTLQPELPALCRRLHEMGFLVKLDTNGYRPDALGALLDAALVDYVAMDIKAPPGKYAQLSGVDVDLGRIQRSIDLLLAARVEYEFRTTVVPGLLDQDDIVAIARWIQGAQRYFLQQFVPRNTLDPEMRERIPYLPAQLDEMAAQAEPYMGLVQVRGV